MEVYGNIRTKVEIDPIDVLESLIEKEIGRRSWVFEKSGKYFIGYEVSAGCHSINEKKEIGKDFYDYIRSLQNIIKYIKENK